jgi:flagellar motor switch protein FliG
MEDVMQSLAAERPKAAEVLRKLMFTFDDIIKLNPRGRLILFDKIPTELIVLALKGTDSAFRDAILGSLATRARRIVESELANGGPASQRDVMKAAGRLRTPHSNWRAAAKSYSIYQKKRTSCSTNPVSMSYGARKRER